MTKKLLTTEDFGGFSLRKTTGERTDEKKLYKQVRRNKMSAEFIESFLERMTAERKESYAQNPLQPVTSTTMAFRMARRCGMLQKLRQMATELRYHEFNLKL